MQNLVHQRCFNHGAREAVARCPECRQFFCRECITEHDDRVLCASCVKKLAGVPLNQRPGFLKVVGVLQWTASFLLAWFFFFAVAEVLLKTPDSFHEGSLWQTRWFDPD
jgi:hypothetical protein